MATKKAGLFDRMVQKLVDSGISARKAKDLAKSLVPTVRSAVKKEIAEKDAPEKVPTKVTGSVRTDLPVLPYQGASAAALLQIMNGLTTTATYIITAVKGETGIVAVRKFHEDSYKIKFYPNMRFWEYNREMLQDLGASGYLQRDVYERMMVTRKQMDQVLARIEAKNKKGRSLASRLLSVASRKLVNAFDALHSYSMPSTSAKENHASY